MGLEILQPLDQHLDPGSAPASLVVHARNDPPQLPRRFNILAISKQFLISGGGTINIYGGENPPLSEFAV